MAELPWHTWMSGRGAFSDGPPSEGLTIGPVPGRQHWVEKVRMELDSSLTLPPTPSFMAGRSDGNKGRPGKELYSLVCSSAPIFTDPRSCQWGSHLALRRSAKV